MHEVHAKASYAGSPDANMGKKSVCGMQDMMKSNYKTKQVVHITLSLSLSLLF